MNTTFTPEATKKENSIFTGDVVVSIPSYDERMDIMIDTGLLEALQERTLTQKTENESMGVSYHKALNNCVKLSYSRYVKVDLVRKKDKKKFTSIEDLKFDPDAGPILQEVALKIATGSILGKN